MESKIAPPPLEFVEKTVSRASNMGQSDYFEIKCVESDDVGLITFRWSPSGSFNVSLWGTINLGTIDGLGSRYEIMTPAAHNMARSESIYLTVVNESVALRPCFEGQIDANTWFEGCLIYPTSNN